MLPICWLGSPINSIDIFYITVFQYVKDNTVFMYQLKVWMDVDNMAGSTLQAMAEAIENADIVLLCYSQKYKISPNCRAGKFQRRDRG